MIEVYPPHGTVELKASLGSDLDVVNAAKVSFAQEVQEYGTDESRILGFLMRERHGSPFEHNLFKYRVRAPIVVFWEWVRHRIASYNVESGRYVEMRPDFFIPDSARVQVGKPGNYRYINQGATSTNTMWLQAQLEQFSYMGFKLYEQALVRGICREQARLFLPMNLYVEFIASMNARSLMNFISLRNESHAMQEIQDYAQAIETLWAEKMPDTWSAFVDSGRVAP